MKKWWRFSTTAAQDLGERSNQFQYFVPLIHQSAIIAIVIIIYISSSLPN